MRGGRFFQILFPPLGENSSQPEPERRGSPAVFWREAQPLSNMINFYWKLKDSADFLFVL